MFAGHAAVALATKSRLPGASLGTLIAASFGLDLIWPILLLTGVEQVRIDPGNTAFTPLDFVSYPWTHSLLLVLVWSVLSCGIVRYLTRRWADAIAVGALVLSHWVLDLLTHRPDLPLWPGDSPMVGLGLWNSIPATLVVEGFLFGLGCYLYLRSTRAVDRIGSLGVPSLLVFIAVIWASGPFAPPPPNETAIAVVGCAMWLFPIWAWWGDSHRVAEK